MLAESDDKLNSWKQQLIAKLSDNGQVIIDVIPELELIIGSQPAVPQLGAAESMIRLIGYFKNLFGYLLKLNIP